MDDNDVKIKQREFEEKLLLEQEESRDADIEARREKLKQEGDTAQASFTKDKQSRLGGWGAEEKELLDDEDDEDFDEQGGVSEEEQNEDGYDGDGGLDAKAKTNNTQKPRFPFIMFFIALVKDIFDMLLTLTGVGSLVAMAVSIPFNIVIFIWMRWRIGKTKLSTTKHKEAYQRLVNRTLMRLGIEVVPFADFLPMSTITVWSTYKTQLEIMKNK